MLRFLTRRVLAGLAILLVASFLYYLMINAVIDPLEDLRFNTDPDTPQKIAQRISDLRLDESVFVRYLSWLGNFVTGDMGISWPTGQTVTSMLQGAIIATIQLLTMSTILAIFLGVAVGVVSALRQYSSFDYLITFVSFLLFSLPSFWVAVLLKQWGAIGYNDFLRDPVISTAVLIGIGIVAGLVWTLAIGGDVRRRVIVFASGFAATFGVFLYLQLSGWWLTPRIDLGMLVLIGAATALAVTAISTGLRNRRSLGAAFTSVGVGLLFFVLLNYGGGWGALTPSMTWGMLILLGVVSAAIGVGVGYAWGGPDRGQSARTAAIVSVLMAVYIAVDRMMQAWPAYSDALSGRPIATTGNRTPNLGGNFWITALDTYTHLILPTLVLLLVSFASYTRYSRASMLETMNQDYIRTARAKGLNERTVIMRHAFRNTLIPLATIVPVDIITLLGGALITERIFGRPGMGSMFLTGLDMNDINPVMAYLMIVAALAIVANIVADLVYTVLDPRIRVNA
ncbi:binding-protein-dependent transport systems inner membrane component [Beutenbergia cavernae DSM 12333]|uniref:Binding-protein-dependent transport systems inner membrane component n=1 Tax=Beutenbergia cavernae (strain ATCC BAA-8 / DSM 12333 / CCUG 43141 / JCM 11478 / NBRC 16432 / NCIMB 13614 / HKI 0122) TaxID=471853 RepID=C5C0X3_BEUC1|nr:ABC transporter permease [Beutenbergia cavernae]ACQ79377.1 binding-protein-dependent transport systems inner membrane component [Beutenbergia cavernae DSM 12333]